MRIHDNQFKAYFTTNFKKNYSCKTDVQRNLLNRIVINKICVIFLLRSIEAIHYVTKTYHLLNKDEQAFIHYTYFICWFENKVNGIINLRYLVHA